MPESFFFQKKKNTTHETISAKNVDKNHETSSNCNLTIKLTGHHLRRSARSRSTSWSAGVSPSAPDACGTGPSVPCRSTVGGEVRELANDLAHDVDKMRPHLRAQARWADLLKIGGASRARAAARDSTNSNASELHRPPVSMGNNDQVAPVALQQFRVLALFVWTNPRESGAILPGCSRNCAATEGTDFGQSRFGHPELTNFCQSNLGQSIFGQSFFGQSILGSGVCHGPKGWGPNPEKIGPRRVGPRGVGGPKISRFLSVSHHQFRSF